MKIIYKYEFKVNDEVIVEMPYNAKVLSCGTQKPNHITIWAAVDPNYSPQQRKFFVRGTGHPLGEAQNGDFIGTVFDGAFVWHVFDEG